MSKELYLGIDMIGTHIKIVAVASKGVIDTDVTAEPIKIIKSVVERINLALSEL